METLASESTRLFCCTIGVLLRKLQEDVVLNNVSHFIVNELHEGSVQSDFLPAVLESELKPCAC
jgi:ATP-dependent RNA helicase DHX29